MDALNNIEQMVGLETAKEQVAQQIKTFGVNYKRHGRPTNGEKLHTLIYGPPGCGKTQLGQYLAELWATSGCLPEDDGTEVFPSRNGANKKINVTNKLERSVYDSEKVTLRQNLALRDTHIKQYQEKVKQQQVAIKSALTKLNNVRKKIKAKSEDRESQIQARFQEIKHYLKTCAGEQPMSIYNSPVNSSLNKSQILPVAIPTKPGAASFFGSAPPPLLPHIPKDLTSFDSSRRDPISMLPEVESLHEHRPVKFTRITRGDLIGKYQGHTTDQVRELLSKHVGGVVMIDEAYDLCTSNQDDFGKESLTEIINFMTTWPDKIVFIFAGYRDKMEETILKFQPGLARRFNWTFEITDYTSGELVQIFNKQLRETWGEKNTLIISDETMAQIQQRFDENVDKFPFYGGDTERLCSCLREVINSQHWELALDDTVTEEAYNKVFDEITFDSFEKAYKKYIDNSAKLKENETKKKKEQEEEKSFQHVSHMYS
jgi:Cdc6-like AAA superfamily ATPase